MFGKNSGHMYSLLRPMALVLGLALTMTVSAPGLVGAQAEVDGAFSDVLLRELGYPEVTVEVGPEGVVAPAELPAGPHLVTLRAAEGLIGYLDIMQPPPGLSDEEATQIAFDAAVNDLAQADWDYLGGTNTALPGEHVSFIIDLPPGEYQWAASSYGEGGENEIMYLEPLTVTAAPATPVANTTTLPRADVTLKMTDDLTYVLDPNPLPAGPHIWEFANTGTHSPHHAVLFRVPDGTTSRLIVDEFAAMASGTPPSGAGVMEQATWVGYAALQSPGRTTWAEFDLEPATYAVVCFTIDPVTSRPHVLDGMVTVVEVG
jgi:hypothetical protein